MSEKKKFWRSKMFWANLIALVALAVQSQTGYVVDASMQAVILGAVNLVLRAVTKQGIEL